VAHWAAKTRPCPTALDEAMSNAGEPSRHLWFLDIEVTIRVSHVDGSDGISVLEHRAPPNALQTPGSTTSSLPYRIDRIASAA
jgi:hypothetical protein